MTKTYLVESYWPGVTRTAVEAAMTRLEASGGTVRCIDSILVAADEIVLSLCDGPSTELVRSGVVRAGLPAERIVECIRVGDGETSEGRSNA